MKEEEKVTWQRMQGTQLRMLEKARKQILPQSFHRECGPAGTYGLTGVRTD